MRTIKLYSNANKIKSTQVYAIVCMWKQWAIKTEKLFALSICTGERFGIACSVKQLHRFIARLHLFRKRQKHDEMNPVQSFACTYVWCICVCLWMYEFMYLVSFLFCSSICPCRVQQKLTQFVAHQIWYSATKLTFYQKKTEFHQKIFVPVNSLQISKEKSDMCRWFFFGFLRFFCFIFEYFCCCLSTLVFEICFVFKKKCVFFFFN